MNRTHGSRKQDIEMFIKVKILKGDIKGAIDICERYNISSKDFGKLVQQIIQIG